MLQCTECEFCRRDSSGAFELTCDPFTNIKEPECLAKWQLIKLNSLVSAYQATVEMYRRLAPLQEKMFRHMEREIDDAEEADSWKSAYEEEDEEEEPEES
ncbi:MAG TPA: hypothetical protein VGM03_06200 [Phycisphaerae bacterium]|jgi:hypothetical protein